MVIAVDFDGTLVEHKYPRIGKEKPFAFETLRALQADGHRLILWTVRDGELLEEALAYCRKKGVSFYAVNSNCPPNALFGGKAGGKVNADLYIDDRNLGGIPEWGVIYEMIQAMDGRPHQQRRQRGLFSWLKK